MAYIRPLKSGKFRADIRMKGIVKNKTFPNKNLAQSWATEFETLIKTIPTLTNAKLMALSDDDILIMGGIDLFNQLGVDIFSIRNASKLEIINQLSKKELLQLTAQQIEAMGGAELFKKTGKRIRYKTLNEVSTEYLKQWKKKDYVNQLSRVNYWCNIFGNKIITDIDIFDIRDQVDLMLEEGQRPTTINRKKAVLSSIFKYALSRGYIDENIVRNVVVDNDSKQRDRVLSDDERVRFLKACRNSKWNKLYLLVLCALTTGARKSELLGLAWKDIDFKNSLATLHDTKNGTSRMLSFPAVVMTELKQFQEIGNNLLFASEVKPEQAKDFKKAWATALKMANISGKDILNHDGSIKLEKFTFHCLRHGFCTQLSNAGKELSQIAELAGHKSVQTTMRYIHQDKGQKKKIVDELAQAFNL
ncbi:MAG: site-specific integrase [Methylococcaceae bacterium]